MGWFSFFGLAIVLILSLFVRFKARQAKGRQSFNVHTVSSPQMLRIFMRRGFRSEQMRPSQKFLVFAAVRDFGNLDGRTLQKVADTINQGIVVDDIRNLAAGNS